ncbi:predicted protein [Uncinocarpus reesii 1704]|uniref:Uncharacterized protein n=1 Tax=Uncinocarpus reesii (strain UAMH 1704) TaxID=336963 RepID=C4JGT3_UNCRE|nr:uncharacterized protein UREG_02595 [Uncinocarpus reesii 1704]EEP77746.1 predicted protein [Uncinocarpus reesii 1704]
MVARLRPLPSRESVPGVFKPLKSSSRIHKSRKHAPEALPVTNHRYATRLNAVNVGIFVPNELEKPIRRVSKSLSRCTPGRVRRGSQTCQQLKAKLRAAAQRLEAASAKNPRAKSRECVICFERKKLDRAGESFPYFGTCNHAPEVCAECVKTHVINCLETRVGFLWVQDGPMVDWSKCTCLQCDAVIDLDALMLGLSKEDLAPGIRARLTIYRILKRPSSGPVLRWFDSRARCARHQAAEQGLKKLEGVPGSFLSNPCSSAQPWAKQTSTFVLTTSEKIIVGVLASQHALSGKLSLNPVAVCGTDVKRGSIYGHVSKAKPDKLNEER